jgi:trehalose 6-phosphate synthase
MAHVEGGRTIVVSNRGPVTFTRGESGEREYSRGAGGLVTALNAVLRRVENAVWIASAQSEEDVAVSKEPAPYEVEDLRIRLVEHDPEAYDLMYNELANPLLWFVQHGLYDLPYSPALGDETRRATSPSTATSPTPWSRPQPTSIRRPSSSTTTSST